jgi:hypothetical protein
MKASSLYFLGVITIGIPFLVVTVIEDYDPNTAWEFNFSWESAVFFIGGAIAGRLATWYIDKRYILVNREIKIGSSYG